MIAFNIASHHIRPWSDHQYLWFKLKFIDCTDICLYQDDIRSQRPCHRRPTFNKFPKFLSLFWSDTLYDKWRWTNIAISKIPLTNSSWGIFKWLLSDERVSCLGCLCFENTQFLFWSISQTKYSKMKNILRIESVNSCLFKENK